MKKIAESIKYFRERKNISNYDIEKATNISHELLYRYEKEKSVPSIINCIKLADYYGVSLDELVGREFGHTVEYPGEHGKAIQVNYGGNNTQNNRF